MLHSRRLRLDKLAAREAAGESFWTTDFAREVRTKLYLLVTTMTGQQSTVSGTAQALILQDEGLLYLTQAKVNGAYDLEQFLFKAEESMVPTIIEAYYQSLVLHAQNYATYWPQVTFYSDSVNEILREHRLSFELINGEMTPFESRELHVSIVAPTLSLLSSGRQWTKVEQSYQDALAEIAKGSPGDGITDAGAALQEALVLLGCDGNALGPLLKSARAKALFAPHDSKMLDAIDKIANWVSADRSTMGDAHSVSTATVDDAWLTVHIVGALLLRLSRGGNRRPS